jgi:hypothetical protein
MRFLFEGYVISLPFVVTHWRFGSMCLERTFIMVVLFLLIIHQKNVCFEIIETNAWRS